jgi:hypothetical protein
MHHFTTVVLAILAGTAFAVVGDWQQCTPVPSKTYKKLTLSIGGGKTYNGDTECASGSGCVVLKYI